MIGARLTGEARLMLDVRLRRICNAYYQWIVLFATFLYIAGYLGIRAYSFKAHSWTQNGSQYIYLGSSEKDVEFAFSISEAELKEPDNRLDRFSQRMKSLRKLFFIMIWLDEKITRSEFYP